MNPTLPDLLPMRPYLREMVWGGRRLGALFGKDLPASRPIGESWEVSAYPEHESSVLGGTMDGRTISRLLAEYGAALIGAGPWERYGGAFPLLIKLIDANADLSIQVHPDDDYARKAGLTDSGKSEAWYILEDGGGRACLGLKEGVGREQLIAAINGGRVLDVVEFRQLQPGDCVDVRPGTVHASCKGLLIYEVQQPSDLTFRIYDYDRLGLDGEKRELHIEQSLDVINFDGHTHTFMPAHNGTDTSRILIDGDHFKLVHHTVDGSSEHATGPACSVLTAIAGSGRISAPDLTLEWCTGATILVPPNRRVSIRTDEALPEQRLEFLEAIPSSTLPIPTSSGKA
jgi:mannose-6-phosphate isomerase